MKNKLILFSFALLISFANSNAQSLTLINNSCANVNIGIKGNDASYSTCAGLYSNIYTLSNGGSTVTFPDPTSLNGAGILTWAGGGTLTGGAPYSWIQVAISPYGSMCPVSVGLSGCSLPASATCSCGCGSPKITAHWSADTFGNITVTIDNTL
jgi:hypothetical protein